MLVSFPFSLLFRRVRTAATSSPQAGRQRAPRPRQLARASAVVGGGKGRRRLEQAEGQRQGESTRLRRRQTAGERGRRGRAAARGRSRRRGGVSGCRRRSGPGDTRKKAPSRVRALA
uniref:Uncharacterized protein n=1 Tax=Oryza sativa subsp. japonica TaxID=39947 RepID=Q6ZF07_ORYSJ|nr:hypothetical protein [Oryza sativa Japonica Group]